MRIGAFAFVRLIVMLRRIWQTLNNLEEIERDRLSLEKDRLALDHPAWSRAGGKMPSTNKRAEIGAVDVADLNKNWHLQHPNYEED